MLLALFLGSIIFSVDRLNLMALLTQISGGIGLLVAMYKIQ